LRYNVNTVKETPKGKEENTMMKYEFEAIAGYKVSDADYNNIIEPMYMATEMSKQEFVKCISRKRFEVKVKTERQYINEIKKIAQFLYENCGRRAWHDEKGKIVDITRKMEKQFGYICFTINGYEYEEVQRGCTYPKELVMCTENGTEIKRVKLVK
jgi:hypothetical protein